MLRKAALALALALASCVGDLRVKAAHAGLT